MTQLAHALAVVYALLASAGDSRAGMLARLEIGSLHFALPNAISLTARGLQASPRTTGGAELWQLAIARLTVSAPDWQTSPLRFQAELRPADVEFGIKGAAYLEDKPLFGLTAAGGRKGWELRLELPPLRIGDDGIGLERLLAQRPAWLQKLSGTFAGEALLAFARRVQGRAFLAIRDASVSLLDLKLVGLNTALSFESLFPLVTLPGQTLSLETIDIGLPLGPFAMLFELEAGLRLTVRRASLRLAGGQITAERFALDLRRPEGALSGQIHGIDLAQFTAWAAEYGLFATGQLDGTLRLTIDATGSISIAALELGARGDGIVRYRPRQWPLADPRLGVLIAALADFYYRELQVSLKGPLAGDLQLQMRLAGKSAKAFGDEPVVLNLQFQGPLAQLAKQGLRGLQLPEAVVGPER